MKLQVKAMAAAAAVLWGAAVLLVALLNLALPPYGGAFLQLVASIYPGFHPGAGAVSVLVGTLWALLDGAIGGALFALLYNFFAARFGPRTASVQAR